jgi:hypothetical protein
MFGIPSNFHQLIALQETDDPAMGRAKLAEARNPFEGFPCMSRYLFSSKYLFGIGREPKIMVE